MNSCNQSTFSDIKTITVASVAVNLILSLPTNSYVACLIATGAGDVMVREFFPLNLAVFEILYCLLSVSNFVGSLTSAVKHLGRLSNSFLWSGRPILQCCICIEQFLAVAHPVLFLKYKPLRYKAAFSGVAWTVIIGLYVFYITLSTKTRNLVFVTECMVLISVMLFCYFSVLVALKRPRPGEGKTERDNNMKRRAILIILVVVVSFVGTYLLWCVAILSQLSSWSSYGRRIFTKMCTFITFASGFVQPLLYLLKNGILSCKKAV